MRTIKHFISYYKPYRFVFFVDLLCASIISIIDILFPLILDFCSTQVFVKDTDSLKHTLLFVAAGLVLMYAARSLCRYYVSAQGHIMGARMESDMRKDLFEQYQKLSFSYYDTHNTGVMMSRVTSDLFDISEFAHHGPENLFISLVKVLGSFVIMFVINWKLAFALLIITVFLFVFSMNQNKRMKQVFMDNRKKIGEVNASLQDSLAGIRVVKSFANEERERQKFGHSNQHYLDSKIDNYMVMGWYYGGTSFLQGLLYVTVIVCGGFLIAQGQMSAIQLATFALYINVYVAPLEILIEFTEMFQKGFSGFKRFEEVIDEIPEITEAPDAKPLDHVKGTIDFEDVSFSYENNETVLDHVDIHIPAGKKVALVGPSGGGKTTLCSLIPRFYDVSSGEIRIDGQNIKDVTVHSLRKAIGLVQQDVYLFRGTIRENIELAASRPLNEEELKKAAKSVGWNECEMDTMIEEGGSNLSGGQRQKIALMQALVCDADILLLDEPTSALDQKSEETVYEALNKLKQEKIILVTTHRPLLINKADRLYALHNKKMC